MKRTILAMSLLLAAPLGAWAASNVDGYYIPESTLELESGGDTVKFKEPAGYGIKGHFDVADGVFLSGTYETVTYDEVEVEGLGTGDLETDLTNARGGVGLHFSKASPFYVEVEYVQYEVEIDDADLSYDDSGYAAHLSYDDSGYAAHLGVETAPKLGFGYYGQVGYLDVGDFGDGFEYEAGIAYKFTEQFGAFVDYHYVDASADDGDFTIGDLRAGLRLSF